MSCHLIAQHFNVEPSQVFAIFEFVHALVETPKFRGAVKAGLSDLMYYIVLYMQITEEQVSERARAIHADKCLAHS